MVFNKSYYEDAVVEGAYDNVDDDFELTEESASLLMENAIIEAVNHMDDESRTAFLESEECQALVEAGKMRKNTLVLLSKKDDHTRRTAVAAMIMAKQNNDPLWEQLKKIKRKKRMILSKIMKKYGNRANVIAKKQQKVWMKEKMPKNFYKFGGSDRISK